MFSRQTIELREAEIAIAAGRAAAYEAGWNVTLAIVDDVGIPILVSRLDRASPASVAIEKARSWVLTGQESKVLEEFVRQRLGVATMKCVAVEGGVPILFAGERGQGCQYAAHQTLSASGDGAPRLLHLAKFIPLYTTLWVVWNLVGAENWTVL